MVGATRCSRMAPFALLALAGCLAAPPATDEGAVPRPASSCAGDPGPPAAAPGPWSIASLPGWTQEDALAGDLEDWFLGLGVFNHVLHGAIAAGADGQVSYQGGDLSGASQSCAGVVAAHRLGYPILVVLGGDRGDDAFSLATSAASRPALVASLVDFIDTYGYDGVSIAWIADIAPDQLSAMVAEVSAAFATRTPRPILTVDVAPALLDPSVVAGWFPAVDAVNLMTYASDWDQELDRYLEAGVPPEGVNLGIGLSLDDLGRADVEQKIEVALSAGLGGVESWELGALDDIDDPRLLAYASLFE
jgi:Glycosyl hydrolases family 18